MKNFIKKFGIIIFFSIIGLLSLTNYIKTGSVDFISTRKEDETFEKQPDVDTAETHLFVQQSDEHSDSSSALINLNTADEALLQTVSGIGPSKAAAIIEYRKQYGNFTCVEELTEVSGIGEKTLEKIKDYFTVE